MAQSNVYLKRSSRRMFLQRSAGSSAVALGLGGAMSSVASAASADPPPLNYGAVHLITDRRSTVGATLQALRRITIPRSYFVGRTIVRIHATITYPRSNSIKTFGVEHGNVGFQFGTSVGGQVILAGNLPDNGIPDGSLLAAMVVRGEISMNTSNVQIAYGWWSNSGLGVVHQPWTNTLDYSGGSAGTDMDLVFYGSISNPAESMELTSALIEIFKNSAEDIV